MVAMHVIVVGTSHGNGKTSTRVWEEASVLVTATASNLVQSTKVTSHISFRIVALVKLSVAMLMRS